MLRMGVPVGSVCQKILASGGDLNCESWNFSNASAPSPVASHAVRKSGMAVLGGQQNQHQVVPLAEGQQQGFGAGIRGPREVSGMGL